MCRVLEWFRHSKARPSEEATKERAEVEDMRPRIERAVRERDRLLGENNYTARIRSIYMEGRPS